MADAAGGRSTPRRPPPLPARPRPGPTPPPHAGTADFPPPPDRAKDRFTPGPEHASPAEVEQLIMDLPAVEAVAIIGVPDDRWGEVGLAVVLPVAGAVVTHDEIAAHLDGRIARYKIPKSTVTVSELPRTASGKVRKTELRERYAAG